MSCCVHAQAQDDRKEDFPLPTDDNGYELLFLGNSHSAANGLPSLVDRLADGNHSNLNGAVLTAYVLYEVMTGQAAQDLPQIPSLGVSAEAQQHLKSTASSVVDSATTGCQPEQESSIPGIPALDPLGLIIMMVMTAVIAARSAPASRDVG